MKHFRIFLALVIITIGFKSFGQIAVLSDGKVGIGIGNTTPSCAIDILGQTAIRFPSTSSCIQINAAANWGWDLRSSVQYTGYIGYYGGLYKLEAKYVHATYLTTSDSRLKSNIHDMNDALVLIQKLRPVYFDYNIDYSKVENEQLREKMLNSDKNRLGFVAQEVQKILPQSVSTRESDSMLCLQYDDFIPLLVKGMQEQSVIINSLKDDISQLKASQSEQKKSISTTIENKDAILYQNVPNPFSETTTINCLIPASVSNAKLIVFNMQGTLLKTIEVSGRNETSVSISASELSPGMYLYSLILDDSEIDTKRMILTE